MASYKSPYQRVFSSPRLYFVFIIFSKHSHLESSAIADSALFHTPFIEMNFNGLVSIKQVWLLLPKELHSDFVFPWIESAFDFIAFLYGFMCDNEQTLYF